MTDIGALSGLRALVVGLGREGTALALYLAGHGLAVTATDQQPAQKLNAILPSLQEVGVSLTLGEHPVSLLDEVDLLFVSPGVPPELPFLQEARRRKIPFSAESRLFCHLCPAPIIAITGSSGKTTTTTLVGHILAAAGRKTWVGGNIGQPLITVVDQIQPGDAVVMELSSFQLEYFHGKLNETVDLKVVAGVQRQVLAALLAPWSPPLGAVLNITPNHLDRHPSMKDYIQAKRAIVDYQRPDGRAIMSLDNDLTRTIGRQLGSRTRWFSLEALLPGGAGLSGDTVVLLDQAGVAQPVVNRQQIKLRGSHNLSNILAACLIAGEAGVSVEVMGRVAATFTGVEHRLQMVRVRNGVSYYNDSIATTPERLIAALRSFDEPIVLLAGGRDKHLPWADAARVMLGKTRHIILFGEATEIIARAIDENCPAASLANPALHRCVNLEEAVHLSAQVARPGEVVLLSPGCASFDAFANFAERGEKFKEFVEQL
ncbi:MAG: UDP-N-acetylmuramoyl-L-alanine--D-glutamate ligase [Anaerolineae bacterium]|nr:UDP-N-acetylmuramoyl-L-alanine--D-glutamate ligase [Anaerolineae bacterium]